MAEVLVDKILGMSHRLAQTHSKNMPAGKAFDF
jgi:hypothetical protein